MIAAVVLLALLVLAYFYVQNYLDSRKPAIDPNPPMPDGLLSADVTWVSDGDTVICRIENTNLPEQITGIIGEEQAVDNGDGTLDITVRMIGFDAPESVHPDAEKNTEEGRLASEYVKSRLAGRTVNLEFDEQYVDKYGRVLAYVWLDGELFNNEVIAEGHAELLSIPPNTKYDEVFQKAYEERNKAE